MASEVVGTGSGIGQAWCATCDKKVWNSQGMWVHMEMPTDHLVYQVYWKA